MKALRIIGIFLGSLLLILAVVPLMIPLPPLENLATVESLSDVDSRFIDLDGIRIHYKEYGQGEAALLLLHGFGASAYSWHAVSQPLARYRKVIAYDRPGFGLTGRPLAGEWSGPSPYGPEFNARLVVDLMDALGIQKAVLVGNSAGGAVAVNVALKTPQRVHALVLVDAAIYSGGMTIPEWLKPMMRLPQAEKIGLLLARSIQERGMQLLDMAWADPRKITEDVKQNYRKPLRLANWDRALWEVTLATRPLNLDKRLGELKIPVLVLTGDGDRVVPAEQSIRLASEIPGARLAVLENCGHVPQEECPAQFLKEINRFLDQIEE